MKVFIAGPRAIKELDENIINKLENICKKSYTVIVGDANGIDSNVQMYLAKRKYKDVTVFASNGIARNNYGDWQVNNIRVDSSIKGFDFYAKKDIEMVKNADIGFMIWNGKSKGTLNNMVNLLKMEKEVILYYIPNKKFYSLKKSSDLNKFLNTNVKLDKKLELLLNKEKTYAQVCLF